MRNDTASEQRSGGRTGGRSVWTARILCGLVVVLLVAASARTVTLGWTADGDLRDWLAAAAFTVIGGRIAYRRPGNVVGWLFLAVGTAAAAAAFVDAYAGSSPLLAWLSAWLWWPAYGLLPLALMLFPDGRLAGPRWRAAAGLAAVGAAVPTVGLAIAALLSPANFLAGEPVDPAARGVLVVAVAGMVCAAAAAATGVVALGLRWRHATDRDRRQLAWLFAAAVAVLVGWTLESLGVPGVWVLGGAAVPVAAAVAIVRHGLYDLGALLSRTATYAVLTGLLGGLFVLIVLVLTQLVTPLTGALVPEAVGALTIALLFQPLRRRVQQRVDRRFNRARYDAAREVERFAADLRRQVELDPLTVELLAVLDRTVQPAQRSLWLLATAVSPQSTGEGEGGRVRTISSTNVRR